MDTQKTHKSFAAGSVIMKQGETGDCAYIIEEGKVEILLEITDGTKKTIGTRGNGSIIGEMALVDDAPRVATVVAIEDCKMIEITADDFNSRLKTTDPVINMITQVILTRYRDMLRRVEIMRDNDNFHAPEIVERDYTEQTDIVESIKTANEFKAAIGSGELELHYQPFVDLDTKQITGFEALMRWEHPVKGYISPGVFIPLAENGGFIIEASRWAFEEACTALKRIQQSTGKDDLTMSVNFTSDDFSQNDFVEQTVKTIEKNDIKPEQIKLEITERILIGQPDRAKEALEQCRKAGINVAIDDFGTGYSSLSYLYYFPINFLKIDQSFMRTIYNDERSLELVKSIIALGKNLGMKIIGEGIEGQEEADLLRDMGCEMAQGYYFAKPMAEHAVINAVRSWDPERF